MLAGVNSLRDLSGDFLREYSRLLCSDIARLANEYLSLNPIQPVEEPMSDASGGCDSNMKSFDLGVPYPIVSQRGLQGC